MRIAQALTALAVLCCASSSWAGPVAVLPVDAEGFAKPRDVAAQVQSALAGVLARRHAPVDGALVDCSRDITVAPVEGGTARLLAPVPASCIAKIAKSRDADEVVTVLLRPGSGAVFAHVAVSVYDPEGAPRLKQEADLHEKDAWRELRALLVQTFSPEQYTGVVELAGGVDPARDEVLLDGVRQRTTRLVVTVGAHALDITDAPPLSSGPPVPSPTIHTDLDVHFEETVSVPRAPPPRPTATGHNLLPTAAAGTAAGLGAVALGFGVVDFLQGTAAARTRLTYIAWMGRPDGIATVDLDPHHAGWQGYGKTADQRAVMVAVGASNVGAIDTAHTLDAVLVVGGATVLVAGGITAIILGIGGGE